MQAGGAQDVLAREPSARRRARLDRATARQGLGEMRRLLGCSGTAARRASRSPGSARLGELVDGARRAGLEVDSSVEGEGRRCPPRSTSAPTASSRRRSRT